jgi:hypothetical protein
VECVFTCITPLVEWIFLFVVTRGHIGRLDTFRCSFFHVVERYNWITFCHYVRSLNANGTEVHPSLTLHTPFTLNMNFVCVKMIHDSVYKMFIVFCTLIILYTLLTLCISYVYDLFHILLSFWQTYGSMECMYVQTSALGIFTVTHNNNFILFSLRITVTLVWTNDLWSGSGKHMFQYTCTASFCGLIKSIKSGICVLANKTLCSKKCSSTSTWL